jgi:hypothetical protein
MEPARQAVLVDVEGKPGRGAEDPGWRERLAAWWRRPSSRGLVFAVSAVAIVVVASDVLMNPRMGVAPIESEPPFESVGEEAEKMAESADEIAPSMPAPPGAAPPVGSKATRADEVTSRPLAGGDRVRREFAQPPQGWSGGAGRGSSGLKKKSAAKDVAEDDEYLAEAEAAKVKESGRDTRGEGRQEQAPPRDEGKGGVQRRSKLEFSAELAEGSAGEPEFRVEAVPSELAPAPKKRALAAATEPAPATASAPAAPEPAGARERQFAAPPRQEPMALQAPAEDAAKVGSVVKTRAARPVPGAAVTKSDHLDAPSASDVASETTGTRSREADKDPNRESREELLERATKLLAAGRLDEAARVYRELLARFPSDRRAQVWRHQATEVSRRAEAARKANAK